MPICFCKPTQLKSGNLKFIFWLGKAFSCLNMYLQTTIWYRYKYSKLLQLQNLFHRQLREKTVVPIITNQSAVCHDFEIVVRNNVLNSD